MPFTKTHLPAHNPIIAPGIVIFKKIAPAVKFFGMYCAHISRMCLSNVFQPQAHVLPHYFGRDSVPKSLSHPQIATLIKYMSSKPPLQPKKAIENLACPEMWPRPINGSGHLRELCDVTMRHLAGLCNFGTLCPEINPCPIAHPNHAMHFHAHAGTQKKHFYLWRVPKCGPAP